MTTHGAAAKAARLSKDAHPELYCSAPRCLYRTGGGPCPKHRAAPQGEHGFTQEAVRARSVADRIGAYSMDDALREGLVERVSRPLPHLGVGVESTPVIEAHYAIGANGERLVL